MAGARIPSAITAFALQPSNKLQALSRFPRISQAFLPVCSRASCSWAKHGASLRTGVLSGSKTYKSSRLESIGAFSTSTFRGIGSENGKNVSPQTSVNGQVQEHAESPSAISSLTSTLKAKARHEQVWNVPNILTFSRLLATPAVGYLIIHDHHLYAFSLFAYAAFSDLLDGWIARRWNLQTVVGSVVDPMADKFLMTTLVACLAVNGSMPLPLATIILGRDVSLAVSALYYRYASLPAPKTMARYWDFSLPSAEVHPTNISKFNTFLQLSLLGTLLCTNLLHDPSATSSAAGGLLLSIQELLGGEEGVKTMITGMSAIVASTTLYSGLEYTWLKDAVKILGGDEELKRKQGLRGRMIMATSYGAFIALAIAFWYKGQNKPEDAAVKEKN
ncbi:cardiolipin synthetase [Dothidotthia symphoricarpi CBS 119687]|uniref:Cardiolipin synthetase n=1 Tax=Dothidotthia symphoricarpi CBS 119687 TaxID=1392245 RepID=A0A6A6AA78_9PLEO|nr:cardiolipin synthetase [Dothidotthia symphoricarpi CBS 119687]KAF2128466.1 cardiolipin synthetase [Dothidotthia symphoricarpi CBS 119687]